MKYSFITAILLTASIFITAYTSSEGLCDNKDSNEILFIDSLDGQTNNGWNVKPSVFDKLDSKNTSCILHNEKGKYTSQQPQVGNENWKNYRIEVEFYSMGGGWTGIDFNMQDDAVNGCNISVYTDGDGSECCFEFAGWRDKMLCWKLYPYSQEKVSIPPETWQRLRIDVGESIANVYLNDDAEPVYTVFDMPFSSGGIRLMTYFCKSGFRNLRITQLNRDDIKPILCDPWGEARRKEVIGNWLISPVLPKEEAESIIIQNDWQDIVEWQGVNGDDRGVIDLSERYGICEEKSVVIAKKTVQSQNAGAKNILLTYTDRMQVYVNGENVFIGPPREWFHEERSKHGFSRLLPDQYRIELPLHEGENNIVLLSEMREPLFGWGFWMRWE